MRFIQTTKLLALLSVSFFAISPAQATCFGAADADHCQFQTPSFTQAPHPTISKGIKLDNGINDVLLLSDTATIPPHFITNPTDKDYFVPQGSDLELTAFMDRVGVTDSPDKPILDYAVPPSQFTASPNNPELCAFSGSQLLFLPFGSVSPAQTIVNRFTKFPRDASSQVTKLTTQTDITFKYTREDCTQDDQDKVLCNEVTFKNYKNLSFSTIGTLPPTTNDTIPPTNTPPSKVTSPPITWNVASPASTNILTRSVNKSTEEAVPTCSSAAPVIAGVCGSNEGAKLTSIPTTDLCAAGNSTKVETFETEWGLKWGWTCNGSQGAYEYKNGTWVWIAKRTMPEGIGCGACQALAKQVLTACTKTCGGGTKTSTWYDGCGRPEPSTTIACNTHQCVEPVPGLCVDTLKNKVDVMFMMDMTGSMGPEETVVRATGLQTITALSNLTSVGTDPIDLKMAVVGYLGDPGEGRGENYSVYQTMTADKLAVLVGMNQWKLGNGWDQAEGAMHALFNLSKPNSVVGWRPDANHVVVWIGDNPSHEYTVGRTAVGNMMRQSEIHPLAFAVRYDPYYAYPAYRGKYVSPGLDGAANEVPSGQASALAFAAKGLVIDTTDITKINPLTISYVNALINTRCSSP